MGLDMYLRATRSVFPYSEKALFDKVLKTVKMPQSEIAEGCFVSIEFTIAYWRGANQIHNWFVKNIQGGIDDSSKHYLGKETLQKLLNTCEYVLQKKDDFEVAKEILPTRNGYFFADSEYNDSYYRELEETIKILIKILTSKHFDNCEFYYISSQ